MLKIICLKFKQNQKWKIIVSIQDQSTPNHAVATKITQSFFKPVKHCLHKTIFKALSTRDKLDVIFFFKGIRCDFPVFFSYVCLNHYQQLSPSKHEWAHLFFTKCWNNSSIFDPNGQSRCLLCILPPFLASS